MGDTTVDIPGIIEENERRQAALNTEYDPLTGIGSPLERRALQIEPGVTVLLPLPMFDEPIVQQIDQQGSIEAAAESIDEDPQDFRKAFTDCRFTHDYEFWAASCVTITDDLGDEIPLILNPPQRESLKEREDMRMAGQPVRQIELKHRQYGSTTEKNAYAFWVQNVLHSGYAGYICSLDSTSATKIIGRYKLIVKNYPRQVARLRMKPYMSLRNTFEIPQTKARINMGSAKTPNAPSGDTIQVLLISEVGKMKSTPQQGADKLLTNMMSMVPLKPETYAMIESTAEISGAWFRNEVFRALNGESGLHLTFINWITEKKLQLPIDDPEAFIQSMDTYERETLWEAGASLEQIHWYREKEKEYQNDWQMKQEYPTNIREAFQSTGKRKIPAGYVANLKPDCTEPAAVGDIVGDAEKGPDALKNLRFEPNPKGNLYIWQRPGTPEGDHPVGNRYGSFADIGGTTEEADWSVLSVFDRYWMTQGGLPERAATWRGHIDQDLFAWKCAQISKWYQNALLAVETNSLKKETTEGAPSSTILDEIKGHYYYLFARNTNQQEEKIDEGKPRKYGFHMNHSSKTKIVNRLVAAARDGEYIERDIRACNEMDYFEVKEDGSLGAVEGMHDDILDTTAGGIWMVLGYMDPPYVEKPEEYKRKQQYNEAML